MNPINKFALIAAMAGLCAFAHAANGNCGKGHGTGNACLGAQGAGNATGGSGGAGGSGGNAASKAKAKATGGASTAAAQGGSATAGGGSATGGAATAAGGQGGASTAAGGSGVGEVATTNNSTVTLPKQPAATAYAPPIAPTAACVLGTSIGMQGGVGFSLGKTDIDPTCETQEVAKTIAQLGDPHTAREHLCHIESYRKTRAILGDPCRTGFAPQTASLNPGVGTMDASGHLVQ